METKHEAENSPQDNLLKALLQHDFETFREHIKNRRVDPNHYYGKPHHATCLQIAARRPYGAEYIRLLLKHVKPNVNTIVPEPVHDAAKRGLSKVLAVLLSDKRTKANATDSKGRTALHYVCINVTAKNLQGYQECVTLLMAQFAPDDINRTDTKGFSAIHAAAKTTTPSRSPRSSSKEGIEPEPLDLVDEDVNARHQIILTILNLGRDVVDLDSVRAFGRTAREDILKFFPGLEEHLPAGIDALRADSHLPLATAIRDGQLVVFRALLEETDTDGSPTFDPNHWFGSPLYSTCLQLACKKHNGETFVEALLAAGADPNMANKIDEKFPIHVACEKAHYKQLKSLFERGRGTNPNSKDRSGKTALHYVVDKLKTEKHLKGNMKLCLEVLLSQESTDVNIKNSDGLTPLMVALEHKDEDTVEKILATKGASVEMCVRYKNKELHEAIVELFPNQSKNLSLCGTLQPHEDKTEWFRLLQTMREDDFVERLDSASPLDTSILSMDDKTFTLLQRAARYGMSKAVKSLLRKGADPDASCNGNQSPPVVLACFYRQWDIVKILVEGSSLNVNAVDVKGNTALHYAAREDCHLETVVLLLHYGADTTVTNKLGKIALGKEQVQTLLDQCVRTNKKNPLDEDYQLVLDYRLLAPGRHVEINEIKEELYVQVEKEDCPEVQNDEDDVLISEMDFLHMMRKNDELSTLLDHPVVFSFLELKWNRVKYLAYINLALYVAFMVSLNIYISTNDYMYTSVKDSVLEYIYTIMAGIAIGTSSFLWCLLLIREIVQCTLNYRKYFRTPDNYLDISILIFSFLAVILPMSPADYKIINFVNVVTIMLSCTELLLLLGRISHFAKYIEMLKVVLHNYFFPLVSYCVIIVAFGLSFHTLFRGRKKRGVREVDNNNTSEDEENIGKDFGTWYMSIIKSLVMMTGELDFDSYPDRSFLSVALFVSFVLLVTVVLLNLLIGIAVSDTQKIEDTAQRLRLQTRTQLVRYAEIILVNVYNSKWCIIEKLPCLWGKKLKMRMKRSVLFPWRVLTHPGGHLRRDGTVMPNQCADVVINDAKDRHHLERELLDRAISIISRRSGQSVAAPATNLAEVNAKLDKLNELLTGSDSVSASVAEVECKLEVVLRLLQNYRGGGWGMHQRLQSTTSDISTFADARASIVSSDEERGRPTKRE